MESVSWAYNGSDTITATVTGCTVGWTYRILFYGYATPYYVDVVATSSTTVLTLSNVLNTGNYVGSHSLVFVQAKNGALTDSSNYYYVDVTVLKYGTAGLATPVASYSYDGADTITVTLPATPGGFNVEIYYNDVNNVVSGWNPFTGDGTVQTHNIDLSTQPTYAGARILLDIAITDVTNFWNDILAAILVYGTPSSLTGTLDYNGIQIPAPVANDSFAAAQVITDRSGTELIPSMQTATVETNEPFGSNNTSFTPVGTLWYKWTCPETGRYTFTTMHSDINTPNTSLAVWTGTALNNLTEIASNDRADYAGLGSEYGSFSELTFNAVNGTDYYIQVGIQYNDVGSVTLDWYTATVPVLSIVEATTTSYAKDDLTGIIALRASDYVASARSGLSVVSDSSAAGGQAVRDVQRITKIMQSPPYDLIPDSKAMYAAALDTITIDPSTLPLGDYPGYSILIRYKATGTPNNPSTRLREGIRSFSAASSIGANNPASPSSPMILEEQDSELRKYPFWTLGTLLYRYDTYYGNTFNPIHIRAWVETSETDLEIFIDQIYLVPWNGYWNTIWYDAGWTRPYAIGGQAGLENPWDGGEYTTSFFTGINFSSLNSISDFQKASDQYSDRYMQNETWDGMTALAFVGAGAAYFYSAAIVNDTFNRTIATDGGWGGIDYWNWAQVSSIIPESQLLSTGVGARGGYLQPNRVLFFGQGVSSPVNGQYLDSRIVDWDTNYGNIIEVDLDWDNPSSGSAYLCWTGWWFQSGVGGQDRNFIGLAIHVDSGGSAYAVIIQMNSWGARANPDTDNTPTYIKELSAHIPITTSKPITAVVKKIRSKVEVTIGGTTISGFQSMQVFGGGYPYPNRAWWDYPYSVFSSGLYGFVGMYDEQTGYIGLGCYANIDGVNTTAKSYFKRFKLDLTYPGSYPTQSHIMFQSEGTPSLSDMIAIAAGRLQVVACSPEYIGDSSYNTYGMPNVLNWQYKIWSDGGPQFYANSGFDYMRHVFEGGTATPLTPSIFWFYRDGQWRNSGIDTAHDLYYYSGGTWHRATEGLQGYLQGAWSK